MNKFGKRASNRSYLWGSDWLSVLLIPTLETHNRICGWWVIGRSLNPQTDIQYLHNSHDGPQEKDYAPGLALWRPEEQPDERWQNTVFVLDDLFLAIRLHLKHFRDHGTYLPVVFVSPERLPREEVWREHANRNWLFWSAKEDERLRKLAQKLQARYSQTTVQLKDVDKNYAAVLQTILETPTE
jgi:hypothetical protein